MGIAAASAAGLQAALLAGGFGAFAGAMAGVLTLIGVEIAPVRRETQPEPLDRRLSTGAFLLASHAIAAAAVWQVPTVGACIAAGLGAGWMGGAAAGLVGMMTQADRIGLRMLHIAARAGVGLALLAPLWAYVRIMNAHAMGPVQIA